MGAITELRKLVTVGAIFLNEAAIEAIRSLDISGEMAGTASSKFKVIQEYADQARNVVTESAKRDLQL
jgi:hypothetical protein